MKQEHTALEAELEGVPQGAVALERHLCCAGEMVHLTGDFQVSTRGRGRVEGYLVLPGVEVDFFLMQADRAAFRHGADCAVLEVTHCGAGRAGWNLRGGSALYLGEGDLALHGMDSCARSEMNFPLGFFRGVSVSADLDTLEERCPEILRQAGVDLARLRRRFCAGPPVALPAGEETRHIFEPLYRVPPALRAPYCQLKAQELLLLLDRLDPAQTGVLEQYGAGQAELVQRIHDQLTAHPDRRVTIEELSRQYLINTSSLKAVFKAVYGQPIAAYMKEYRVRLGAGLLRSTDLSVAQVARRVGYESQGKFARAFQDVLGILPSQYRRQEDAGGRE